MKSIAHFMRLMVIGLPLLFAGGAAHALTQEQVATVIDIVEKLSPELGTVAYDDDEADRWFEDDSGKDDLIGRAGFDQSGWKMVFDATITGFLATVPEQEFISLFDTIRQRVLAAKSLNVEHREMMLQEVDKQLALVGQLRTDGKPYASLVRPFSARLRKLLPME